MKYLIILLIFVGYFTNLPGQTAEIDSVRTVLSTELSPAERAIKMKDLAMYFETVDTAKSYQYYNEALQFAKANQLDYEAAVILQNKSYLYRAGAHYQKAIAVLDSALTFLENSKSEKTAEFKPKIFLLFSLNYKALNNYQLAADFQLKAIEGFEQLKMYELLTTAYYNLGIIYQELGEYEKLLECGEKALTLAKISGDAKLFFIAESIKAYAYNYLNELQKAEVALDSAKLYYDEKYYVDIRLTYFLISGNINLNLHKLEEANDDFTKALGLSEKSGSVYGIIQSKMQLARILTLQKKFGEAETMLMELQSEIGETNENSQKIILLDYFARLYEEWGDFRKALAYHKQYIELNDSVKSLENRHYIVDLETRYEVQKKESMLAKQETQLSRRKMLIVVLVFSLALLLVFSLLIYRYFRQRQILQQQQLTQFRLNATEAVLKGEDKERARLARDLHDGLGGMLSGIKFSFQSIGENLVMTPDNQQSFERSMDMLDSSIKEIRRVAHNMMPEALHKFGLDTALRDFCNNINKSGILQVNYQSMGVEDFRFEQSVAVSIYRIVQELLNNIIKHSGARTAVVQLNKTENEVTVTVEDDGKGFDVTILDSVKGMGWENIRSRVDYLKGRISLQSRPGEGTSVFIELNIG